MNLIVFLVKQLYCPESANNSQHGRSFHYRCEGQQLQSLHRSTRNIYCQHQTNFKLKNLKQTSFNSSYLLVHVYFHSCHCSMNIFWNNFEHLTVFFFYPITKWRVQPLCVVVAPDHITSLNHLTYVQSR